MQALTKTEAGLSLLKTPVPSPGPGEVLVKVMCAGLCRTDVYLAHGQLECASPRILGHEASGGICRLGEGVSPHRLGERVGLLPWIGCSTCEYCRQDIEGLQHLCPERRFLGRHLDGCFAEFVSLRADRCLPLPEALSFQAGAYLEPVTAALGVLRAPLKKAGSIAVIGKNRIASLTTILLREYAGLDALAITSGEAIENSFNLVIETQATEQSLSTAMHSLRPDGLLVLKSRPASTVPWPIRLQVEKEISTMGVSYGSLKLAAMLLSKRSEMFQELWHQPVPLTEWEAAFQASLEGDESRKTFFLPRG